jgi:hypothetical protein
MPSKRVTRSIPDSEAWAVKLKELRPSHPLLPVNIREVAFFETIEQWEGVFEVLGLRELLGLGILDASLHEGRERLVVVFVPSRLQLCECSSLHLVENNRITVHVDRMGWAGFQSQMGSNTATMALELDEPAVIVVAFKVRERVLVIVLGGHSL